MIGLLELCVRRVGASSGWTDAVVLRLCCNGGRLGVAAGLRAL